VKAPTPGVSFAKAGAATGRFAPLTLYKKVRLSITLSRKKPKRKATDIVEAGPTPGVSSAKAVAEIGRFAARTL
jgi:hypothetical protein